MQKVCENINPLLSRVRQTGLDPPFYPTESQSHVWGKLHINDLEFMLILCNSIILLLQLLFLQTYRNITLWLATVVFQLGVSHLKRFYMTVRRKHQECSGANNSKSFCHTDLKNLRMSRWYPWPNVAEFLCCSNKDYGSYSTFGVIRFFCVTRYDILLELMSGIPQSSVLGPILFIIFINDLPDSVACSCKIFVDDTKLYGKTEDGDILQNDLNNSRWFQGFLFI